MQNKEMRSKLASIEKQIKSASDSGYIVDKDILEELIDAYRKYHRHIILHTKVVKTVEELKPLLDVGYVVDNVTSKKYLMLSREMGVTSREQHNSRSFLFDDDSLTKEDLDAFLNTGKL